MDVVTIDTSTWLPNLLVEGYSSFIWTERYLGAGEFELKSRKIAATRALLPLYSKIGVRDSQEVMTVESHSIEPSEDGPELVVTGRTFETILEARSTVIVQPGPGQNNMWTYGDDDVWPSEAARALIMSHLTVCTEAPYQKVDGVSVANLITSHGGEQMSYEHEPGDLYPEITRLLDMEDAGIRNQLDLDGDGGLKIYIYRGLDRTVNQTVRTPLIFSLSAEHIVDPKYLWAIKDYRNLAYVVGDAWQQRVYAPGVSESIAGEHRRILYVDGSQIKAASSDAKKTRQAKALGLAALAQHNQTLFFDAEVSPTSPYVRGVNYNLGDKVTLMAQYGISQTMIISEFVRTEDKTGERAYPTLVTPSELEGGE